MRPTADVRTKLICTALRSMHRTSFENVGVAQITEQSGVPKGSFYYWFPSKEALGAEVIDAFAEAAAELRARLLQADGRAPLQRLRDYSDNVIGLLDKQDFKSGCLLGAMSLDMARRSELMRERLSQAFERWEATLHEVLIEAASESAFPAGLNPADAAAFILNTWEGALLRMKAERSPLPPPSLPAVNVRAISEMRRTLITLAIAVSLGSYGALIAGLVIAGIGAGVLNCEVVKVGMTVIPPERSGMASGVSGTVRFTGIVIGFAALGAVFTARIKTVLCSGIDRLGHTVGAGRIDHFALMRSVVTGNLSGADSVSYVDRERPSSSITHRSTRKSVKARTLVDIKCKRADSAWTSVAGGSDRCGVGIGRPARVSSRTIQEGILNQPLIG
jgi:TetR/AcrR family transcriptional repressor of nem operon